MIKKNLLLIVALLALLAGCGPTPAVPTVIPEPEPTPDSVPGGTKIWPNDGRVMLYIPAGEFVMGSTEEQVNSALELCNETHGNCPQGPESGKYYVQRGGAWIVEVKDARSTSRYQYPASWQDHAVGFRCAASAREALVGLPPFGDMVSQE